MVRIIRQHLIICHPFYPKFSYLEEYPTRNGLCVFYTVSLLHIPSPPHSLLAAVSYYFTSGPWKLLWVRLGYDPRSSPDSKPYQCLDYRIPREIAGVSTLESRRNKLRKGWFLVNLPTLNKTCVFLFCQSFYYQWIVLTIIIIYIVCLVKSPEYLRF